MYNALPIITVEHNAGLVELSFDQCIPEKLYIHLWGIVNKKSPEGTLITGNILFILENILQKEIHDLYIENHLIWDMVNLCWFFIEDPPKIETAIEIKGEFKDSYTFECAPKYRKLLNWKRDEK